MKLIGFISVFAVALSSFAVAGCSGNDGAINVTPATTPLTTQANDALFTVTVTDARSDGYDLVGLVVKAIPDGKDPITVTCTPADTNGNGKLDKDETVTCNEGSTNVFDATFAGQVIDVELYAQIDSKQERVGDAKWTVAQ